MEDLQSFRGSLDEPTDIVCEKCGKPMVKKLGRFGYFLACTGFPECRNTRSIPLGKCPRPGCGGDIVARRRAKGKGREFYGCTNYPTATSSPTTSRRAPPARSADGSSSRNSTRSRAPTRPASIRIAIICIPTGRRTSMDRRIEEYLAYLDAVRGLSPRTAPLLPRGLRTLRGFRRRLRRGGRHRFMTASDIRAFAAALVVEGKAGSSVNRALSAVRGYFRYRVRFGGHRRRPLARRRGPALRAASAALPFRGRGRCLHGSAGGRGLRSLARPRDARIPLQHGLPRRRGRQPHPRSPRSRGRLRPRDGQGLQGAGRLSRRSGQGRARRPICRCAPSGSDAPAPASESVRRQGIPFRQREGRSPHRAGHRMDNPRLRRALGLSRAR